MHLRSFTHSCSLESEFYAKDYMVNLLVKYNWQHRRFELLYSAYGNQRDTQRNTTSSYFLNQLFVFLIYNLTQNSNKKY